MTNLKEFRDLAGVFAVPPLARKNDPSRTIDFEQNDIIVRHTLSGGITRLIYGGNAFMYHLTLAECEALFQWLAGLDKKCWPIPSIGPSFGRAIDQAALLRKLSFSCVMVLPCGDPRDASGIERGYREISDTTNCQLMLYVKEETNFGADKEAGLDVIARLVDDRICTAIKYAVVRADPNQDPYLDALLKRVDRKFIISGIGERPAIAHLQNWKLPGFTTGSGCIAPKLSQSLFSACARSDWDQAEDLRRAFIPLEDIRDESGPARVLHAATELAGIAKTGPIPPYVSELTPAQVEKLSAVAQDLYKANFA